MAFRRLLSSAARGCTGAMTLASAFVVTQGKLDEFSFKPDPIDNYKDSTSTTKLNCEKYCITSNTITYGAVYQLVPYFTAFPYPSPSTQKPLGRLPCWGISYDARRKQRYYGYMPFGSPYFSVTKDKNDTITPGFNDISPSRKFLPPIYSNYVSTSIDPFLGSLLESTSDPYEIDDLENRYIIFKGLFLTGFLLNEMVKSQKFADCIFITSASSKTSTALAWMIKNTAGLRGVKVVGLTSRKNADYVSDKLGSIYDQVYTYDAIESIPKNVGRKCAMVDVAGNVGVRDRLHRAFQRQWKYTSLVGMTHVDEFLAGKEAEKVGGIVPEMFFAPSYVELAQEEYGPTLETEMVRCFKEFIEFSKQFMVIHKIYGSEKQIEMTYEKMLAGQFSPSDGFIIYNDMPMLEGKL